MELAIYVAVRGSFVLIQSVRYTTTSTQGVAATVTVASQRGDNRYSVLYPVPAAFRVPWRRLASSMNMKIDTSTRGGKIFIHVSTDTAFQQVELPFFHTFWRTRSFLFHLTSVRMWSCLHANNSATAIQQYPNAR